MIKDMSKAQFTAACKRYGFKPTGILGYFDVGIAEHNLHVCAENAGARYRDQLAYLIRERDKWETRFLEKEAQHELNRTA